MSDSKQSFSWYAPDDIRRTVENGVANDVSTTLMAEYLSEHEFDDIPAPRLKQIIENLPISEDTESNTVDLSQPKATDADPRDDLPTQLTVGDLEYTSNREAARLVGLALELFEGNTVRPTAATEVETDLIWHRQHVTVGFRIVPTPTGSVGTKHIDALQNGQIVPDDVRRPSKLAIVTNRVFTDEALDLAEKHNIYYFDAGHVEEWFRRARIPMTVVGTLLEDGESHDGPLTDLVELPSIPAPRKAVDPLEINRAFDTDSLTTPAEEDATPSQAERTETSERHQTSGLDRSTARDDPLNETQPPAGKTGTLYADPDADGDFEAFDEFVADIEGGAQQSPTTAEEEPDSQ